MQNPHRQRITLHVRNMNADLSGVSFIYAYDVYIHTGKSGSCVQSAHRQYFVKEGKFYRVSQKKVPTFENS